MSVSPNKNDTIKFIPSKTDFIDKNHMIITSCENSTQQMDYIMKKFKFYNNEKENSKLPKTHSNSTQFFKNSKSSINDWKNKKLNSKTALNTFHNSNAKPPTTFRNTYSSNNFLARYKESAEDNYTARATYENCFDDDGSKDKQIKNYMTAKCSFSQPLPLLYKENEKLSINMNFAKTLSANNTMTKFYKVKKKKHSITQLELQSIGANFKINTQKEFITDEYIPNKKIYLKKIEFSLIKKNQPMDVNDNGGNKNIIKNPSKRLYLDYLNYNNKDLKNPYEYARRFHAKK